MSKDKTRFQALSFVEVHSPVFLNGTNLSTKLDPKKKTGLILFYDVIEKRLWIEYNGSACFFGIEGAIHPVDPTEFGYELQSKLVKPDGRVFKAAPQTKEAPMRSAQIETPMQKVQQPPQPRTSK